MRQPCPVRRFLELSSRHSFSRLVAIGFWGVASGLLVAGALVRWPLPPVAVIDPDAWGYLHPVMTMLSGEGFEQAHGRSWLYSCLLASLLALGKSFEWIVRAQQIGGLISGALMCVILRTFLARLRPRWGIELAGSLLGLAGLALFLFSADTNYVELCIRPEGIATLMAFAALWCLQNFVQARWRTALAPAAGWELAAVLGWGGLTIGLAWMNFLLKPNWGFAVVPVTLPVVLALFAGGSVLVRAGPLLAGAALCIGLMSAPAILRVKADPMATLFLPGTLVTMHANVILQALDALPAEKVSAEVPEGFLDDLRREFSYARAHPRAYEILGHDADYLMYRTKFLWSLRGRPGWSDERLKAFCFQLYFMAWKEEPLAMTSKIRHQLAEFFWPASDAFASKSVPLGRRYASAKSNLPIAHATAAAALRAAEEDYRLQLERAADARRLRSPKWLAPLSAIFVWLARALPLCLAVGTLLLVVGKRPRALLLAGVVALCVWLTAFTNATTIAIIHSFDMGRYFSSLIPICILACELGLVFFASALSNAWKPWPGADSD